jgi:hypothetical protein
MGLSRRGKRSSATTRRGKRSSTKKGKRSSTTTRRGKRSSSKTKKRKRSSSKTKRKRSSTRSKKSLIKRRMWGGVITRTPKESYIEGPFEKLEYTYWCTNSKGVGGLKLKMNSCSFMGGKDEDIFDGWRNSSLKINMDFKEVGKKSLNIVIDTKNNESDHSEVFPNQGGNADRIHPHSNLSRNDYKGTPYKYPWIYVIRNVDYYKYLFDFEIRHYPCGDGWKDGGTCTPYTTITIVKFEHIPDVKANPILYEKRGKIGGPNIMYTYIPPQGSKEFNEG